MEWDRETIAAKVIDVLNLYYTLRGVDVGDIDINMEIDYLPVSELCDIARDMEDNFNIDFCYNAEFCWRKVEDIVDTVKWTFTQNAIKAAQRATKRPDWPC